MAKADVTVNLDVSNLDVVKAAIAQLRNERDEAWTAGVAAGIEGECARIIAGLRAHIGYSHVEAVMCEWVADLIESRQL